MVKIKALHTGNTYHFHHLQKHQDPPKAAMKIITSAARPHNKFTNYFVL